MPNRDLYLDLIDRDRAQRSEPAAETRKRGSKAGARTARGAPEPPHSRRGYPRKRQLDRKLARHYEDCKVQNRGRFGTKRRLKQYCSAVAWTIVDRSGQFSDYQRKPKKEAEPMKTPPRDSKGRFRKRRSSHGSRRPKEAKRASAGETSRRGKGRKSRETSYEARKGSKGRRSSVSRRGGGSRRSGQTNIAIVPVGTVAPRESRRGRGRRRAREAMYEAPRASGAGMALLFTGGLVGYLGADALDRFIGGVDPASTTANLPAPYTVDNPIPKWNNDSAAMQPGFARMGAQFALALFGYLVGWAVKSPAMKFLFYGIGTGAGLHLAGQIVTAYILVPMVKNSTGTGARMYQHEINVLQGLANPSGGILGGPLAHPKGLSVGGRVGAPPQLPAAQPSRIPVALASLASAPPVPVPAPRVGQPPPPAHVSGCACADCTKKPQPATLGAPPPAPPVQAPMAKPADDLARPNGNGHRAAHPLFMAMITKNAA